MFYILFIIKVTILSMSTKYSPVDEDLDEDVIHVYEPLVPRASKVETKTEEEITINLPPTTGKPTKTTHFTINEEYEFGIPRSPVCNEGNLQSTNECDFLPMVAIFVYVIISISILVLLTYMLSTFIMNNIDLETFVYVLLGGMIYAVILGSVFSQSYILWFVIKKLDTTKTCIAMFLWIISVATSTCFIVLVGLYGVAKIGTYL